MLVFYFFYVPILIIAWALVFPTQAMAMIENLKPRLAYFIIQRLIAKDIHLLKTWFRQWGKLNGYEQRLIDEVLAQHTTQIARSLEARYSRVNIDEWFQ